MGHDFLDRLVFLIFICVFVRTRRDMKVMFVVFMLALYVAVPSALYNWLTGSLLRGFRAAVERHLGRQPEPARDDLPHRDGVVLVLGALRPGLLRQVVAMAAMAACVMVLMATGSRSGLLGLGMLALLLQTGPQRLPRSGGPARRAGRGGRARGGVHGAAGSLGAHDPLQSGEGRGRRQLEHRCARRRSSAPGRSAKDYPLFGVGLGNFREVSRQIYQDDFYPPAAQLLSLGRCPRAGSSSWPAMDCSSG